MYVLTTSTSPSLLTINPFYKPVTFMVGKVQVVFIACHV